MAYGGRDRGLLVYGSITIAESISPFSAAAGVPCRWFDSAYRHPYYSVPFEKISLIPAKSGHSKILTVGLLSAHSGPTALAKFDKFFFISA